MKVDNLNNPVLGIDLGTTYSSIARWDGQAGRVYPNKNGDLSTPSVVYFDSKTGKYLVGEIAVRMGVLYPENVCHAVKRQMDTREAVICLGARLLSPVDVSSIILGDLAGDAASKFPAGAFRPAGVVVTVPYYFKAHQVQNTADAAARAGITLLGIVQEPIAASLAYALDLARSSPSNRRNERILVFDLGGGTFDLTVFELKESSRRLAFEVLATGGDDRLGGIDFDRSLADWLIESYNLRLDRQEERVRRLAMQKLFAQVRTAKEHLSFAEHTYIGIPDVVPGVHIDRDVTRSQFEHLIRGHLAKMRQVLARTLREAGVGWQDIHRVILVGGSSKIPAVQRLLEECGTGNKIFSNISQDLCVAEGAAVYAAYLSGRLGLNKKIDIQTRTSHALGVELSDGSFYPIIQGNRRTPCSSTTVFTTDEDNVQEMEIAIYQGSEPLALDNALVGKMLVKGLPRRPVGELDILVTVKVDQQQMVAIRVEEPVSGFACEEKLRC